MDFIGAYTPEHILFLLQGLIVTLKIAGISIFIAIILGSILGFLRYSKIMIISHITAVLIECMRNLPPLLVIFFTFFALPRIGIKLSPDVAAISALAAYGSALIAEIVRGGLDSIDKGQMEAASSQGFTYLQTMRYIYFPQAFKRMIPAFTGQIIILIKNSSLAVVISLEELTRAGQLIYVSNVNYVIPILLFVAFTYFVINYSLSLFSRKLEKKMVY